MTEPRPRRWLLYFLAATYLLVAIFAVREAVGWYGHPMAGVFLDPGGLVSNIGFPAGDWRRGHLEFPDAVLEVNGNPLVGRPGMPAARVWDRTIERAFAANQHAVDALVQTRAGVRNVHFRIRPLEPVAWWIYAGSSLFAGFLYAVAGLIALWASPTSPLARTFARVGLSSGLLVGLMFDFHTSRALAPIFLVGFALVPVSLFVLALRLPDDAPLLRKAPWLEQASVCLGFLIAAVLVYQYAAGQSTRDLQRFWTSVLGTSFLFFGASFLFRFARARGLRRDRMRALLLCAVPPHALVAACVFQASRGVQTNAILYGTLSLFPIATAYAFIRYDLWGSRALLSRLLTQLLIGGLACGLAVGLGTAVAAHLGMPFGSALLAVGLGAVAAPLFVFAALLAVDRFIFRSRVQYKPTVEQLSEELIAIASPDDVARAVERTIRRWLPCEVIEISLLNPQTIDIGGSLRHRETVMESSDSVGAVKLTLPIEFGGVALARLRVGEKAGQALFTRDDVDLLRTIANQGALALAHARAYQELEVRRREQAAAWRGERAALVETLAAEIAHEIRYPINFFRSVFERGADGRALDVEDVEIGREEVDRLERLVSGLRRMVLSHRLERRRVRVLELCDRVEILLRDALADRRIERSVPAEAEIVCDPDQVMQMLVNLVANALEAAGDGPVGVAWRTETNGAELLVWDTGPGFGDDGARLFAPGYTTRPRGTGLGLAITQRLVRAHGWSIAALRRHKSTQFVISIPRQDVVVAFGDAASAGAA